MKTNNLPTIQNLPLAAIKQEFVNFNLGGALDKCTKTFKRKVEAQRPKKFFADCSLYGTKLDGVDILCILDVPNFKAFRRAHKKPTGMWLGALVQTEDAGICWISPSHHKEKLWKIYTENLIRQWARLRNCPDDMPIHRIVSDLLIETMGQDGVSFRYQDSPDTVYQPLGELGTVQGTEIFVEDERCKIYDTFVPEDGDAPKAMEGHRPEVAEIEKFLRENGINVNLTVAS